MNREKASLLATLTFGILAITFALTFNTANELKTKRMVGNTKPKKMYHDPAWWPKSGSHLGTHVTSLYDTNGDNTPDVAVDYQGVCGGGMGLICGFSISGPRKPTGEEVSWYQNPMFRDMHLPLW